MLYSAYCLPNIIVPLLFGWLIDKIGSRYYFIIKYLRIVLVICEAFLVLGQFVFYEGTKSMNYSYLLLGRFLFGLGGESLTVSTSTIEATWFRGKELSFAISIDYSMANLAAFSNDALEPAIYNSTKSLAYVFWIGFMICVYSLIASLFVYYIDGKREHSELQSRPIYNKNSKFSCKDILSFQWDFWVVCIATAFGTLIWVLFNNIASEFFQLRYGFSLQTSGTLIGLEALVIGFSGPFLGILLDKFGHKIFIGLLFFINYDRLHWCCNIIP